MQEIFELTTKEKRLQKIRETQHKLVDPILDSAEIGYCCHSECGFRNFQKYEEILVGFDTLISPEDQNIKLLDNFMDEIKDNKEMKKAYAESFGNRIPNLEEIARFLQEDRAAKQSAAERKNSLPSSQQILSNCQH